MKKLLTLALALVALAVFAGLSVGQDKQKVLTGKVTQVNKENKTDIADATKRGIDKAVEKFTVEVTFSAKAIPLPKEKEKVDVIYTPNPTGGPPEATTLNSSKSNSFRLTPGQSGVTGKVLQVNPKNNTFTVEVTFSAKTLKGPLPEVGKIYDITFTGSTTPGGPPEATTLNSSRSNNY